MERVGCANFDDKFMEEGFGSGLSFLEGGAGGGGEVSESEGISNMSLSSLGDLEGLVEEDFL